MIVIVDGHNAMHRLGISRGRHEDERRELLVRVREIAADAEVFFDARHAPPGLPAGGRDGGILVRYCREEEADRAILDRVRSAERPDRLLVVTDDREVAAGARRLRARTSSVRQFFGAPGPGRPPDRPDPADQARERGGAGGFTPADFDLPDEIDLG